MAAVRRSPLASILALFATALVFGAAFVPSGGAPRAAPSTSVSMAVGAAAPLVIAQPALAVEGDGAITGFEWAGYVSIALVLFVFYNAQKGSNDGK
mmetsp:Transcript_15948/g.35971  ORF Transcript_15948/g.35971 Transcript_15948/m.35971 type:complete len:96 (-) Transcript_15948:113-400(-)